MERNQFSVLRNNSCLVLLVGVALLLGSCSTAPPNVHSVLVWHHGALVSEEYHPGPDSSLTQFWGLGRQQRTFDAQTLHDVRSVSKSVVALEAGIILARHSEVTLDTPVADLFPRRTDLARHKAVTLRHLLTMSSGLDWREWGQGTFTSDETGLVWDGDPVKTFLGKAQKASPGTWFNYSGGSTQTLMLALAELEGRPFLDLVRDDLFAPLDITRWEWATGSGKTPLGFAGLRLLPGDMGKLGLLVLGHGVWNGRQVVPAAWIDQMIHPQIATGLDLFSLDGSPVGYGFQWWTGTAPGPQGPVAWASAIGNGGQRIFVVPDLDLVVTVTAGDYGSLEIQREVNQTVVQILANPKL